MAAGSVPYGLPVGTEMLDPETFQQRLRDVAASQGDYSPPRWP